jgi:hypothetical protein
MLTMVSSIVTKYQGQCLNCSSGNTPYDYEQRYPPDEHGEELGPNARVWCVYHDEATAFDMEMVEGWRDTTDVLLVFVSLFYVICYRQSSMNQGWSFLRRRYSNARQ